MSASFIPPPGCWGTIGTSGDRTCPQLERVVHCRNCPVLVGAAEQLFERPAPPGYVEEWGAVVREPAIADAGATSVVVFRLGQEWMALETHWFVEIASVRTVHRIAHRTHTLLAGLVNIRGSLELCVSLEGVLDMPLRPETHKSDVGVEERLRDVLAVVRIQDDTWVFRVQEVQGVHRVPPSTLEPPPATLSGSLAAVTRGMFILGSRRVALLDGPELGAALLQVAA